MTRYYFHFWCRGQAVPDHDGAELDDLASAHRHALRLIRQTIPLFSGEDEARGWYIEIANEEKRAVLTVLFPRPGTTAYATARALAAPAAKRAVDVRI